MEPCLYNAKEPVKYSKTCGVELTVVPIITLERGVRNSAAGPHQVSPYL